jgi:putative redox protein
MSHKIQAETTTPGAMQQRIEMGAHALLADEPVDVGGADSGPNPHDLFDASLAACKAMTAHWYAKQRGYPLERVSTAVERDASNERQGQYGLTVTMTFHGPLSDEQRARLLDVVGRCPVHKLMTTIEVAITTRMG